MFIIEKSNQIARLGQRTVNLEGDITQREGSGGSVTVYRSLLQVYRDMRQSRADLASRQCTDRSLSIEYSLGWLCIQQIIVHVSAMQILAEWNPSR